MVANGLVLVATLAVMEGTDPILVDRPKLPTGASLVSGDLTGASDYTLTVYDLSGQTVSTALVTETATASTASTSNISTEPLVATAVKALSSTYGGIWGELGRDDTGYTVLYRILQSDLSSTMEGGHTYGVELSLLTTLYGRIRRTWLIQCLPLLGA